MSIDQDQQLWAAIASAIEARLNALRELPITELLALPEASSEQASLLTTKVSFTTFKESLPGGATLIVVQGSIPVLFGLGWRGSERGLVLDDTGIIRDATQQELSLVL